MILPFSHRLSGIPWILAAACSVILFATPMRAAPTGAQDPRIGDPVLPGLDPTRPLTQFSLDVWSERDGLPQNFISAIAQTPDGFLWAGSERGLIRFDGTRITVFTPENLPGLSTAWITALTTDRDGSLWVGTGGGGLFRLGPDGLVSVIDGEVLGGTNVRAVLRDRLGRLWVATEGMGMLRLNDDGSFATLGPDEGLSHPFVLDLVEDETGAIWVASSGGLDRIPPNADRIEEGGIELGGLRVQALEIDGDGVLWLGTGGDGLFRVEDGAPIRFDPTGELSGAFVQILKHDREGALWIGTNGGGLFRNWNGEISRLTDSQGLPSNLVRVMLEDREGGLWIGLVAGGLARLQDGIFDNFGVSEGLSSNIALAVREMRDGSVWVGTPGSGVNRIAGDGVTTFTMSDGLGSDFVISVTEDDDGSVWVGTIGGGASRIRDGGVETFGLDDGLLSTQVSVVHVDRHGRLWLGYRGQGIQQWRPDPAVRFGVEHGIPGGTVTTVLDDSRGNLWVGSREGLARVDVEAGTVTAFGYAEGLAHGHVTGLYEDGDGGIWVATMGGLARIRDDEVFSFGVGGRLPSPEPMAVTEDAYGYLWLSSSQGLLRIPRAELDAVADGASPASNPRTFGRSYGLRSAEANGGIHPSVWRARDGSLWFPTMMGVVRVDPLRTERPYLVPTPVIEFVVAADTAFRAHETPVLERGMRTLDFHFTAPTFRDVDDVRLRYRLEGFDDDWVLPGDRAIAQYTNLPPRNYRFVVAAADRTGQWNPEVASMEFTVDPYLHERWSVRTASLLLLLIFVGMGFRVRIRRMERREEELLRVVAEREQTEAALRGSEQRLYLAMEAGSMGTWEIDLGVGAVTWSSGMTEMFGPAPDTLDALVERMRTEIRTEEAETVRSALDRVIAGEANEFSVVFALAGDEEPARRVELRGRRISDDGAEAARVVGVAADVSALLHAQEALRTREEELRQAQKMEAIGRLAGGVAHDFNNLLAVIGMNTRLALDTLPADSPIREDLIETVMAGDRAADLTRQLLAFSRKQILQPRILDLNQLVRTVERMLRRLMRSNVILVTDLDPTVAPIRADASGIDQILVNLLVNAQDAMPAGGAVTITTRNGIEDPKADDPLLRGPHVVLSVIDTGAGMDEETRQRAFEPFFTTKQLGQGTGLGLASVYGLVQQIGGRVDIESEVGVGTSFRICLPLANAEDIAEATEEWL